MDMDKEKIIKQFEPLIGRIINELKPRTKLSREDLFQEAVVGLLRALENYDPQKGPLPHYLGLWVRFYMQEAIEHDHCVRVPTSALRRDVTIKRVYDKDDMSLLAICPDARSERVDSELDEVIRYIMAGLPDHLRIVLHLHYSENKSCRDIAPYLGVSHNTVNNYIRKATKIIKTILQSMGVDDA